MYGVDLMGTFKLDFRKNKNYKYIILNCNDFDDADYIVDAIFIESKVFKLNNDIIIFYADELESKDIYDMVSSISVDLDKKIKMFKGNIVNSNNIDGFDEIYKAYVRFSSKDYSYSDISDLVIYLLTNDMNTLSSIKNYLLEGIINDTQIIKLILSLCENNLNVTKTANSMYMHRNTINNKLEMIKKETGFDIQVFNDAMTLFLLIKLN